MGDLGQKRLFLLDMDGTIYLDDRLFPGVLPFLEALGEAGGRHLFLTNNSSRSADDYVRRLEGMGVPARREDFLTSVDALIAHLRGRPPYRRCYAFGTAGFRRQLAEAGIPVTDRREEDVDCLLIGFDTELTFRKLEDACILLNRGVDFIAANPDWVCPTWYGAVPDCGSVCEMLRRATGRRPQFIGKPEPAMALLALERTGMPAEAAVMVGDRMYTDIAAGANAGIDTAFVLSGEGTMADAAAGPPPTWIFDGIAALHRAWETARRQREEESTR